MIQARKNCEEVLKKRVPQLEKHPDGFDLLKQFFLMEPDQRMTPGHAVSAHVVFEF